MCGVAVGDLASSGRVRAAFRRAARALVIVGVVGLATASSHAQRAAKPARAAKHAAGAPAPAGLVLGEYQLIKVVDGDTIKVEGLDQSLRLLGIDAEETFKSAADREAATRFAQYRQSKRGAGPRPVKMATPMGELAKAFALEFFAGVERVTLERDHPDEIHDRYRRYLAYVMVRKAGAWRNYNVECVRAGMSPYFAKYGTSRRFHAAFVAAEAEARQAERGIWAPDAPGYADYAEREAWWSARGRFVDAFRAAAEDRPDHIDVTHEDAPARLAARVGQPVVVLGVVADVWRNERGPTKVTLARQIGDDVPLIFFSADVLAASRIEAWKGEYVVVSGVPTLYARRTGSPGGTLAPARPPGSPGDARVYADQGDHHTQLQIVVHHARQIRRSPVPGLALSPPVTVRP